MHPKIYDFIKFAKKIGIGYVYLSTNGHLVNADKVLKSGLDSIKFSLDAATKETYENLRIEGNWETLLNNLKTLKAERKKRGSKIKIFGSFVVTDENRHEVDKYDKTLVDETLFSLVYNQGGQVDIPPREILPRKEWMPCYMLWNRFIVNYEGKLTICCVDFEGKMVYGDLNKNTLKECWNNKKMQTYRTFHKKREFEKLLLCKNCSMPKYKKLKKDIL